VRNAALAPFPGEYSPRPAEDDEFTGLYRQYHPQLFRYVTHHFGPRDADEVTQEALARALRSLDRARTDAETWAWLIRVARNVAHDLARGRRICDATDDDTVLRNEALDDTVLPEPAALLDERRRIVRRALKMLPPSQRRILLLYEVDELNCPTIARLVGSTEDAVRKALQRARRRFAAEIRTIGGGVCGSVTALLRGGWRLRRRVRGLPAATASTTLCALAGTLAFTVASQPALRELRPDVSSAIASRTDAATLSHPAGVVDAGAVGGGAGGAATSARRAVRGPGDSGGHAIRIPVTPLSPGQHNRVFHYEINVPVVGPTEVYTDVTTDPSGGIVCNLDQPYVTC
jgi:RNA polymerase sigma-70 factor (ECF subfamily)